MKLVPALALAALAGCSTHASLQVGSGSFSAPSVGLGVQVQSSSPAAALIGLGFVARAIHGGARIERPPELDATRAVREQDCTRPIEDPGANLRCR